MKQRKAELYQGRTSTEDHRAKRFNSELQGERKKTASAAHGGGQPGPGLPQGEKEAVTQRDEEMVDISKKGSTVTN